MNKKRHTITNKQWKQVKKAIKQRKAEGHHSNEKNYTIYEITCKKTGMSYIGHTSSFFERIKTHLDRNTGGSELLNEDVYSYGKTEFDVKILDRTNGLATAKELESKYIVEHKTLIPFGYNITIPVKAFYIDYFNKYRNDKI